MFVVGRFRRAINLAWDDGVLALVTSELDVGPFHLVVETLPDLEAHIAPVWEQPSVLRLGACLLDCSAVQPWEPLPRWAALRPAPALWAYFTQRLADLTCPAYLRPHVVALQRALDRGAVEALVEAARALAGLGVGLTPSGDDVLAGVMLRLHLEGLAHLTPFLYAAAAPRTTRLSRAFLAAARDGLVNAAWMRLLHALHAGTPSTLEEAVQRILAYGATSGADMLMGFALPGAGTFAAAWPASTVQHKARVC